MSEHYGQYGARPPRLARDAKISLEVATRLFDAYWALNWSINTIAENTEVKKCLGVEWQLNPVNNIWYYLKTKKDRFSTLCQGTGAYAFDIWVEEIFQICQERWGRDPLLVGQFHDEIVADWDPDKANLSLDETINAMKAWMSYPGEFSHFPLDAEIKYAYRYIK